MKKLMFVICLMGMGSLGWAQSAPPLGSAQSFAVLGASTVTNTGPTAITGDLGVSPGTAVTGFPPGKASGVHAGDATATAAQAAAHTAYANLVAQHCGTNLTGKTLGTSPGAVTLSPGVYCFDSSAQLTGTLTLNAVAVSTFSRLRARLRQRAVPLSPWPKERRQEMSSGRLAAPPLSAPTPPLQEAFSPTSATP